MEAKKKLNEPEDNTGYKHQYARTIYSLFILSPIPQWQMIKKEYMKRKAIPSSVSPSFVLGRAQAQSRTPTSGILTLKNQITFPQQVIPPWCIVCITVYPQNGVMLQEKQQTFICQALVSAISLPSRPFSMIRIVRLGRMLLLSLLETLTGVRWDRGYRHSFFR